jgi:eukaryotic-like serine/threonine-protein kinase
MTDSRDHLTPSMLSALAARYEIEREIGRGGMATVFLARDVKHGRRVALKVLHPELGAALGAERFIREISVTANLQHPNLLPLFDSGEVNGLLYYVMPFVDGETLRDRLAREKQLPIDDAVRIAIAVCGALDYAHRHGIVHRDLKPENILLHDGQPVVGDFGIALAVSAVARQRVTLTGISLGTPQYMSPEQGAGERDLDARSDIYSLAAVTYEMLAGEPPHDGATAQAVIARLVVEEPRPISQLRRSVPQHVVTALHRALSKVPADRFSSASQFADGLAGRALPVGGRVAPRNHRWLLFAAMVLSPIVVAGGFMFALAKGRAPSAPPVHFVVDMPPNVRLDDPPGISIALAPDGRSLAFLGRTGSTHALFLRKLGELESRSISIPDGSGAPLFAPDGKSVLLYGSSLMRLPLDGGAMTQVVAATGFQGSAWGNADAVVYATGDAVWRVPAAGGTPRLIAKADAASNSYPMSGPFVLPDGKTVLFEAGPSGRLGLVSIDSGPVTLFDLELANAIGYADGSLIFGRYDGSIYRVSLDVAARRLRGDPVRLLTGASAKSAGGVRAALSRDGTLALLRGQNVFSLTVLGEVGTVLAALPQDESVLYPTFSPDGKRIAFDRSGPNGATSATPDIWMLTLDSKVQSRVTSGGGSHAVWTPDGRRLLYIKAEGAENNIYAIPADGSGASVRVARGNYNEVTVTPDGHTIVARVDRPGGRVDLVMLAIDGPPKPTTLVSSAFSSIMPAVSPDGKWLAYESDETGRPEIYVRPLSPSGGRVQISADRGREPRWSPDGKRVIYRAAGAFRAARLSFTGGVAAVAGRDSLFEDMYHSSIRTRQTYDVSPDGHRFVVIGDGSNHLVLAVYTGWWNEVRGR